MERFASIFVSTSHCHRTFPSNWRENRFASVAAALRRARDVREDCPPEGGRYTKISALVGQHVAAYIRFHTIFNSAEAQTT